ncbi:replication protein A 70 kDa DNA-binding subunit C-like [Vicia villosa]|uniref:replication protein A 70 kDa DNA-binding subunit C-like n=2 Tax=Vicia villosa TaxID=3911 RepID=UPI00273B1853|nr:replication protein A 70 kDa DNA-binding subunit C-like [Vicia villosa]
MVVVADDIVAPVVDIVESEVDMNMSRKFDCIKDISDKKETWRLAVRIIDLWSIVNSKGAEHLEMVIMDAAGDRIQVLIRADHTDKWKSRIQENMTCIINNDTVFDNDFQWKLCDHSKKFVFLGGTTMKHMDVQNIPPLKYYFKEFCEINAGKCHLNRLEDIIGVVHEINNMQSNTPGKKTFVALSLKDLSGDIINCTLWESYGTKFLEYYNDPTNTGAIVIILTHAMIKDSQVSNAWSGSKLLINEDIQEISEFLSKLPANEQSQKPSQSAKSMSLWSGGSQFTTLEKFVHKAKCIPLSQFCKIKQDMLCVTVGTTTKFYVSKHGWFYYGCTKCSVKATDLNNPYQCVCGENVHKPIPRYKVDIYVCDGESKFRFVFWDADCEQIIGQSADSMHKSMLENGEDDPMVYPDELDMLLEKKMALRAKVQPTFGQASVWKFSYDEEFVSQIEKDYIADEAHSLPPIQNAVADHVDTSMESLSAFGENDPDKSLANTPSKSVSHGVDAEESDCQLLGLTQYSGTKPPKKVKIEPNA